MDEDEECRDVSRSLESWLRAGGFAAGREGGMGWDEGRRKKRAKVSFSKDRLDPKE